MGRISFKKGDKICLDTLADVEFVIGSINLKNLEESGEFIVSRIDSDGKVFLEGYEEKGSFNKNLFCLRCRICQKEEAEEGFDKCFSCARGERDKLYEEFIVVLSSKQLELFKAYSKASEDFTSIIILMS